MFEPCFLELAYRYRDCFNSAFARERVHREVQTVIWEAGKEGAADSVPRQVSRWAWRRRINRELEAKKAHKLWISEGLNREAPTMN